MAVNETVGINLVADTKSLRSQLKEAIQDLAALQNKAGASAKEIANAAKRAAELKDRIGDAKATVEAFNPDAKFKSFGQALTGVTGAFAAMQGAMALFGVESENVQKQLLKVQAALALSEGLNSIMGSIDGFKNLAIVIKTQVVEAFATLKGAIMATGLGTLAVALAAGMYLWNQYTESIEKAKEKFKDFEDSLTRGAKAQKEGELEALKRLEKNAINEAKLKGAKEEEIAAIEEKFARLRMRSAARYSAEVDGIKDADKEGEKELIKTKDELNQKHVDNQLKRNEELLKAAEARADKEIALEQERAKRIFEIGKIGSSEYEQKMADLTLQFETDLKLFDDNESAKLSITRKYQEQAFELWKANRAILTDEEEKEVDKRFKKLDKQADKEIAEKNKTNSLISKAMDNNIKKVAENEVKVDRAAKMAKLGIAADALGALSGMAEQGSALQKGLALGQVAVDTAMAISSLTANSEANPGNAVTFGGAGIAQFASGILRILANIAQAKSIIEQVPGGGGGSIPMPSVSTQSAPIEPTYTAPTATRLDSTSLNTIQNVVARAYVVESDISNTQSRIQRIQNAARF